MKSVDQANQPVPAFVPKAPDAIMAELWSTKQRINAEAGYDIDKLLARVKRVQGRMVAPRAKAVPRSAAGLHRRATDSNYFKTQSPATPCRTAAVSKRAPNVANRPPCVQANSNQVSKWSAMVL